MKDLTRRDFALGVAVAGVGGALASRAGAAAPVTARTIVDRIKAQCARQGVAWQQDTVDTWKIGNPDAPVRGVAVTFMGTLALMQRAARAGANFIVSHEPIFYNHRDETAAFRDDPVYRAKTRFAADHGLVVWRFHDHWHDVAPEPMSTALIAKLDWQAYVDPAVQGFQRRFVRPPTTLAALADEVARKLPSRSIRVIGDPRLSVSRIATISHNVDDLVRALAQADVAIAPEIREWDSAEYARDLVERGQPKALIMIAHERGEEDGMARCTDWLRPLVPEVPVTYLPSGEPFRVIV